MFPSLWCLHCVCHPGWNPMALTSYFNFIWFMLKHGVCLHSISTVWKRTWYASACVSMCHADSCTLATHIDPTCFSIWVCKACGLRFLSHTRNQTTFGAAVLVNRRSQFTFARTLWFRLVLQKTIATWRSVNECTDCLTHSLNPRMLSCTC